jgi:CheY-like chemotaxis protein
MKIMIVDDNPAVRSTIRRILSTGGDTFTEFGDGVQAVEAYNQIHPDCVLMDIKMNEMDGIRATEAICRIDPSAKVIIVTQYRDGGARGDAERAGAVGYVLKEDLVDLGRIIERYRN